MSAATLFRSRPAGVDLRHFALFFLAFCFVFLTAGGNLAHAQEGLLCTPSAAPLQVRYEGITEEVGNILLTCSGGIPSFVVTGNLTFFLNVNITNKLAANNTLTDVLLTIDTGSGPTPVTVPAQPFGTNAVAFNGISFTVPPSGDVNIELSNLRADATQLGTTPDQAIMAHVAFSGTPGLAVSNNAQFVVGFTQTGLLATFSSNGVTCTGSPLPSILNISNLFSVGTRFFSTRITEGFASAFRVKDAFSDTGTRIIVSYSGFPAGAQLFVPDFVAGSNAVVPTSGGDLGLLPSGGTYSPSTAGSLLLILVSGADQNGAGGSMMFPKPPFALTPFNGVTQVPLTNGAGATVYEVADTNPNVRESAQFPTFLGLAPFGNGSDTTAYLNLSFAPVSTVHVASDQPVPRFINIAPLSDCSALGDCNASYFPHLLVNAPALNFGAAQNAFLQTEYVQVQNTGQGELNWTASITYQSGSGWLTASPDSGINDATIRVDAHPSAVPPGTYQATLTVDAGPLAGSKSFPVTFTVTGPGSGGPLVTNVFNAASLAPGPLVPGSLAAIFGSGLDGEQVSVTFDGTAAPLLYKSPTQINLQVPASIAGETSSQMMVDVNGQFSAPQTVPLAVVAPGIFNPGVLNQNGTLNTASNPAARGTTIEILGTGLISQGSGAISAVIGGQTITNLSSAGPLPGVPGVQQVTVAIPTGIPAGATQVEVCASAPGQVQPVCSMPASVMVK
jgi:uncharacterized protein (TIGR03437 family)